MKLEILAGALVVTLAVPVPACGGKSEPEPIAVTDTSPEPDKTREEIQAEAMEHYREARAKEPELNPEEPREKLLLVWKKGGEQIRSIHQERYDILRKLKGIEFDRADRKLDKQIAPLYETLKSFSIGRQPEKMETAPQRLCKLIAEVRGPAEALIATGTTEIEAIDTEFAALEEKEEAGEKILQRTWDKIDERRKRWSAPVLAGKTVFLAIKSMLDESLILAKWGPRRVQLALRDCLTKAGEEPFPLDIANEKLAEVVERAKWYRSLR